MTAFGTILTSTETTKFTKPDTILVRELRTPRIAVSTTSADVCWPLICTGLSIFAAAKKLVLVEPGQSAIILIPNGRFSSAMASENEVTNAFVAAYVAKKGIGWKLAAEDTLMIVPLLRSRIAGKYL